MAERCRNRFAILLLLSGRALWPQSPADPPPMANPAPSRGGAAMTPGAPSNLTLEVALSFRAAEVLSGAGLPVVVTLRNTMAAGGAFVPSPQADCPFTFTIEPEKKPPFEVSRQAYLLQIKPQTQPPREQEMAALRAGATLEYPLDLADFLLAPLEPGTYRISAAFPLGAHTSRSPAAPLRVIAPRVELLSLAPDGGRSHLGAALVHRAGADSEVLYQRESAGGQPSLGYFRSRKALRQPTSLAISTDAEGTSESRWVGWTEDGRAGFVLVWGTATLHSAATPSLGAEARLLSPGWSFENGSALFLAAAPSGLTLITIPGRDNPVLKNYLGPGAVPHDPVIVRAGLFKSPEGEHRILLVWLDGRRLMCSILNPLGEATAPRPLMEAPEPFVAVDIESVAHEGAPVIHAVFTAAGEVRLVRIRGGEPNRTDVLPPVPDRAQSPLHWTVCAGATPAVAIQEGEARILAWHPGAGWQTVRGPAGAPVSHLRLVRLEAVWAAWADSAKGIQLHQITQ